MTAQQEIEKLRTLQESFDNMANAMEQWQNFGANGIETELQQGKSNIVFAIKSKGVDASQEESMTSLADKITKIKKEVEVKTLPAESSNVKANDLFNMIMKSQKWDSIYETVYENYVTNGGYVGVLMTALARATNTSIALTGADAYYILEEDKFYTTDENKNLVTSINGVETHLGNKNHLWDINNAQYWRHVFYLYVEGSTADGSRENVHESEIDYCRNSNIPNIQYKNTSGTFMHFHVSNPDTCNLKVGNTSTNSRCHYFYTNIENANAQWALANNGALTFVDFSALKKLTSGTLLQASRVRYLELPSLESVSGGTLLSQCNALETIELPSLTEITTENPLLDSLSALKYVVLNDNIQCKNLYRGKDKEELTIISKSIEDISTKYPFIMNIKRIIFPIIESCSICIGRSNGSYHNAITTYIYFGALGNTIDTIYIYAKENSRSVVRDIEIGNNTKQIITIQDIPMLAENIVNHIFKKLADNNYEDDGVTPAPAIKITIGSNNLAKLTDEEKAIATDKNYILA